MKKIIFLLLLCIPTLLFSQNYEQQGDELFAQAQYEKAAKKYSAAIEMSGESSSLQAKKEKCAKCASLLARAKSAEENASDIAGYESARKLYSDLFAIHAMPTYKNKANALQRKADTIREQQRIAERAERERQAKIEAERKAKAEAERQAQIEKDRKSKEAKAKLEADRRAEQERQAKRKYEQERQAKLDAERAAQQSSTILFEKTEHDFGKINEANGTVSVVFKFKNNGQNPLVLSNVRASCGCMTVTWPKEPIAQGQTGSITVTYNPSGRPGRFQKTITITSNAPENTHRVYIKGDVIPQ